MEETQEAIKPEPVLSGWGREKEFKDGIKPEPVMPKRVMIMISILFIIVFNIILEDSFFSMIFGVIILIGAIKEIFEKEKKKKKVL
jgi:hypothetical protein